MADDFNNKWTQPADPPAPLFFGKKERDLVKQVNDELIEHVIGQQILYYPIDMKATRFNSVYGEAIEKTFLPPVRVYVLIEWEGLQDLYSESIGVDKTTSFTAHFHKRRLTEDQDLFVRIGDYVCFGSFFYQIVKTSEPRLMFGQVENKVETTVKCVRAREGLFDAT